MISDGGLGDRVASFVYRLAIQVLCAKGVPRADAALYVLQQADPYGPGSGYQGLTSSNAPLNGAVLEQGNLAAYGASTLSRRLLIRKPGETANDK